MRVLVCFISGGLLLAFFPEAKAQEKAWVKDVDGSRPQPRVVVDEVCAWPVLNKLPDGAIGAAIYNRPSHGRLPADVECWATTDEGQTWKKRGVAAPRDDENSNRMSKAFGVAKNGDLVMVSGGWTLIEEENFHGSLNVKTLLRAIVCRSSDGGRTWSVDREGFPAKAPDGLTLLPTGSIRAGKDGNLRMAAYTTTPEKWRRIYVLTSKDDGRTWGEPVDIDAKENLNETYLWTDGSGWWLAVARHSQLELYESDDDAKTWHHVRAVTEKNGIPGQLMRLADGRLLLMNGNRTKGDERVEVRVSSDRGRTWTAPVRLVEFIDFDGGYPSSVQLSDGRVLTAFYAKKTSYHDGYHMGTVTWSPEKTFPLTETASLPTQAR